MSTVHSQPYYHIKSDETSPPGYPVEPVPDIYQENPGESNYEIRKQDLIAHVLRNPAPRNTKAVWYELLRMLGGQRPHEGVLCSALDFVDSRKDCADFVQHSILRLLYQFDPRQAAALQVAYYPSEDVLDRAKRTTLKFKYFPDEPGIDSMCTWTENHYILFTSAAYLGGQLYPDEVFTNSGETGRQKMDKNRPRILRWLDMRFRSGFSEWLSHVYYDEDLTALLSLYEFAQDKEIRDRAEMVIDLILLDMALNSFKGVFGSTHGRAYENTKKWASNEGTTDTLKLLFGMGVYSAFDNMSAAALVLSRYEIPQVIGEIACDLGNSYINRQRMGFNVKDAEKWGLNYEDIESGMFFYTYEAYLHPLTASLTIKMFDAFNWWQNDFFRPFKPFRQFLHVIRKSGLMPFLVRFLEKDISRNMRDEPNIYTCRTPDYMLSTAQNHRSGYGGDQQHIWQATLGPDAVCFTTHPGRIDGVSPNYWAGNGMQPSSVQYRNLNITVYNTRRLIPALYVPIKHFFTHAWLPKDKFDEFEEIDGWHFACIGDGYLALRSMQPVFWNSEQENFSQVEIRRHSEDSDRELIAPGKQNIWICQLGRQTEDGSFENFKKAICSAEITFDGLQVTFDSPGNGQVDYGWQSELKVNGKPVSIRDYPRYDNPYVKAEYDPTIIKVHKGKRHLKLDWRMLCREKGQDY